MAANGRNLLTTGEAAKLCSVTADTVLKWIKKGRLSAARTAGGHYRIDRQRLQSLVVSAGSSGDPFRQPPAQAPEDLRCWEYLGDRGGLTDDCRQCVVYRTRAARCYVMAGVESDVGHTRLFCRNSCEECAYYRRVKGLATNVLCITSDDALIARLVAGQDERVTLRFARDAYGASAAIQDFQPAFAAVDVKCSPTGDAGLLDSLAADPRLPGLRIILVVPSGMAGRKTQHPKNDLIVTVLEKPFGIRRLAATIGGLSASSLKLADGDPPAAAKEA